MKRSLILASLALLCCIFPTEAKKKATAPTPIPEKKVVVIPVETENTQLILHSNVYGTLRTFHYGQKIANVEQFEEFYLHTRGKQYGHAVLTYPTVGGVSVGTTEALHVKYANGDHNTELYYAGHKQTQKANVTVTEICLRDTITDLQVKLVYEAYTKEDVIVCHSEITNGGKKPVELINYASSALQVKASKYLLTHFHGSWAEEMMVENEVLGHDTKVIETRIGASATKFNNPAFMVSLNTGEYNERQGEVIAGALAWSGNFKMTFERDYRGDLNIVSGINPHASTYKLKAGESFITPDMIYTFSNKGAGQASRNLHSWGRNYGVYGGGKINPTLLNSWEGAYFNFTTSTLTGMIDNAAAMGLEMFVLDDGWFGNGEYARNDDHAGLGDWELNTEKLPEGIDYIANYAHEKGLKFGIWIEPEMVNPNSNLAHQHPDWVIQSPGRENYQSRQQWILDLSNPAVQDFVFGVFDRTMQLSDKIDYIKWDCNRMIHSFGSTYLKDQDRLYIEYVQGFYKVLQRIREKYPNTLIQCCSSGGSRVEYGQLAYFNEVWTSDNSDALKRVKIQYGTSLIYPPFIMGAHVSAVPNHQTKLVTPLKFRFDIACAGRLGLELQPKDFTEKERKLVDRCIASYEKYRDLIFQGDLYRLVSPYEGSERYALMYVSADKRRAVVFTYSLSHHHGEKVFKVRLDGLDPSCKYKVEELNVDNSCWKGHGKSFSGDFLMYSGILPVMEYTYDSAVFYLEAE